MIHLGDEAVRVSHGIQKVDLESIQRLDRQLDSGCGRELRGGPQDLNAALPFLIGPSAAGHGAKGRVERPAQCLRADRRSPVDALLEVMQRSAPNRGVVADRIRLRSTDRHSRSAQAEAIQLLTDAK